MITLGIPISSPILHYVTIAGDNYEDLFNLTHRDSPSDKFIIVLQCWMMNDIHVSSIRNGLRSARRPAVSLGIQFHNTKGTSFGVF